MKKISSLATQNKKLSLAVIALLLAILIVSSATFSWIEGSKNGKVSDTASSVSAGDGLYFTDVNGDMINSVVLHSVMLQDCTSKDGRNFFFPTTETKVGTSSDKMVYRAGTDADKNTKYISEEFNIVSYSKADLYIDTQQSFITCDNPSVLNALRLSLNFNDGSDPIVICPGMVTGYTRSYNPVTAINSAGAATEAVAAATALTDYSVSAERPIASFTGDETKRVTLNMWLEGTDADCITGNINSQEIKLNIVFSTASEYTKQITFVDYSPNGWVDDKSDNERNIKMFAIDKASITDLNNESTYLKATRYEMALQSDNMTYKVKVPESVTDVIFGRFDPDDSTVSYNFWATTQSMSDGDMNTYYAIGNGKDVDKVDYGYWVKSSCDKVVNVELTETPLKNEIKFTNVNNWTQVYAYFFVSENVPCTGYTWPGKTDNLGTVKNDLGQYVTTFSIPSDANYVIFNAGNAQPQTVDIKITESEGVYLDGGSSDGKLTVKYWDTTRENKTSDGIFAYTPSGTLSGTGVYNPNIYFTSSTYGTTLNISGGVFNPTTTFDKSTNYGFTMYQPDKSQRVYRMTLPADASIMFNGHANTSSTFTFSSTSSAFNIKFYTASSYVNY